MQSLLIKFEEFESLCKRCRKVFCSTCGGLASAVKQNMSDELDDEIKDSLLKISLNEFRSLGEWSEFFARDFPREVSQIIEKELRDIDSLSVNDIDTYLLQARYWRYLSPTYNKLLELGIKVAIESENESLIETLCIVFGENLSSHKQLFELAMKKYRTNKNIHRVLYNKFREEILELRNFIGDGTSVYYH